MSGVQLQVDTREMESSAAWADALARLDTGPLFDEIGAHLLSETIRRFKMGLDPHFLSWQPSQRALGLRPGGRQRRGRRAASGGRGKTLVDRGHLRDSITYVVGLDGRSVMVGTNIVYGAIHQFGGRAGRGGSVELPARPYLGLSDPDRDAIANMAARFVMRALQ